MTNKFAQAANAHMLANDMRVKDFQNSLGLSKHDYFRYCNGEYPHVTRAIRIARVLKTTVEEIWG
jgi:DNA-binding XRE family transcriptional regulator